MDWGHHELVSSHKITGYHYPLLAKFYLIFRDLPNYGEDHLDAIIQRHSNRDFKAPKSQKSSEKPENQTKLDKRARREAKIKKRLEDGDNVERHIKSFSVRKAPLYNK